MLAMEDPACSGDFALPMPRVLTSEEILEGGPVQVFATPTQEVEPARCPNEQVENDKDEKGNTERSQWVVQPVAPAVESETTDLWHYTDAAGLIGIIESHSLWATSLSSLNDSAEYKHGRDLLERLLERVIDSRFIHPLQKEYIKGVVAISDHTARRPGLFVVSASIASNSLAQWRSYGGFQGHAVLLDPKARLSVLSRQPREHTVDTIPHEWRRVIYDPQAQAKLIAECLGYMAWLAPTDGRSPSRQNEADRAVAVVVNQILAYCKDPSFAEEQEVRMLVQSPGAESIRFRHGNTGVTPYVVITGTTDEAARPTVSADQLPIRSVVVGPFPTREESGKGTIALLQANGYDNASVLVSTSTLR
jgi:hypothetical protein